MTQPSLFEEPPVLFVTVCHHCGQPVEAIPVEAGETWQAAVLWGYVALRDHEEKHHKPLT